MRIFVRLLFFERECSPSRKLAWVMLPDVNDSFRSDLSFGTGLNRSYVVIPRALSANWKCGVPLSNDY